LSAQSSPDREAVVLVHGLWVRGIAMALLARRIARCGYRVVVYSYPSMRLTLTENAERFARYCRALPASRLHLVGHSLGGLVALRALELPGGGLPVGRVVLMGTPFGECHAARRLARLPGGAAALGRSLPEWLAGAHECIECGAEIGVIAGSLPVGLGRIVAPDLQRPCDGVVSVLETGVPGMRARVVLPVSHSGMLVSQRVARCVCAFLRDGGFDG